MHEYNFFEPCAGNGALAIAGDPSNIVVNEIDRDRLHVLKKQGFKEIFAQDANKPFPFKKQFDGIIANPPFGGALGTNVINGYHISGLDQQIIVKALEYLKDDGKASFIIGGQTKFEDDGRIKGKKDKAFLSFLARFYFIEDVVNVDGALYHKQGTSYPIRLIFINSRKRNPEGFYPLNDDSISYNRAFSPRVISSFEQLYERITNIVSF